MDTKQRVSSEVDLDQELAELLFEFTERTRLVVSSVNISSNDKMGDGVILYDVDSITRQLLDETAEALGLTRQLKLWQ